MSTPTRPRPTAGLRHVALFVHEFEACLDFYTRLLGMAVEWQPDGDNVFLCSGNDNLALHRAAGAPAAEGQRLDHIGFIIDAMDDVDRWHDYLLAEGVTMRAAPRTHRDGARSFYCEDPAGNVVQLIFHPPLSRGAAGS
ncbi:MAG: VOC family protein [Pseudomonadales bacterium]|jgi:catechol 2,3-dioxygenase-like lactoylglutathione lyase family enzyme|nr:VOC family protein [Pseudomonadales bacterium]